MATSDEPAADGDAVDADADADADGGAPEAVEAEAPEVARTDSPSARAEDPAPEADEDPEPDADQDSASASADAPDEAPAASEPTPAKGAERAAPEDSASSDEAADPERTSVFRMPVKDSEKAAAPAPAEEAPPVFEAFRRNPGIGGNSPKKDSASRPDPRLPSPSAAEPTAKAPAAAADSERTAVFRAVRPDAKPDAKSDAKPDAEPEAKPEAKAPAKPDAAEPTEKPTAKAPATADSERTAVFRAVRPDAKPDAKPEAKPEAKAPAKPDVAEPTEKPTAKAPAAAADSERTAVFRAVRPDAKPDAKSDAKPDAKSQAKPQAKPEPEAPSDSERTAVFRAVRPDAAPADATGRTTGTGPSTTKSGAGDKGSDKAGDKPGQRPSTFVPLRGEGAPKAEPKAPVKATPPPAPKPPAGPAAATAPKPPVTHTGSERTTQQPLPPRPPLDLLAELTNNPPPPPSPMRTTVRRVKIYAPLLVLLLVVLGIVQLVRPLPAPALKMTAKTSYAFEGGKPDLPWPTDGQAYMAAAGLGTLGSSGEMKPVPIASVTKSMTAYIIMRDHPFKKGEKGQMIDIDKTAETEGKKNNSTDNESTLDTVQEGQKISEYDAIAALMIPSANNIARLLARWDSGSQEAFVAKMNATAKELGMTNTTYTDPSGLDATTVSTAEDQVKLGLKLVEMDALLDITKKPSWVDPSGKTWPNWNRLVPYNDSLGIKTGTTTKAGGNLLFAAQKKVGNTNQLIVGAVLGQHKPPIIDTVVDASRKLLIGTQKSLQGATVVKKGDVVGYVDDGLGGRTPVVATADVQAVGWSGLTVTVKLGDGGTKLPETAKAGTQVGVLTVGEGASQVKVPVALQRELAAPGLGSKLTRVG
ncbi:hypothetical protein ACFWAR_28700 [Streptomyces sp. NPDC059917]|uniref:hypothetical protein n=1 Tax=Streptomyces sp. NPDC059917 TaxID=3347002 RepID=UPI00364B8FFB